jgi:hypothetical protein
MATSIFSRSVIQMLPGCGDRLKNMRISDKIVSFIKEQKRDYRVCTSCGGAILLPTAIKRPKPNDLKIPVGDHFLYVSATQARYIEEIDDSMLMTYLY